MGLSLGTLFPLRWRLWLGRRLFEPLGWKVTRVSWHRVIKGPCYPSEVEAMQYLALQTDIPIPRLYATHTMDNRIYIEMAYIPGTCLDWAWHELTPEQKDALAVDLESHMASLRQLKPQTEGLVGSAFGNPLYDARIGFNIFGPSSLRDFISLTRGGLREEDVAEFLGKEVEHVRTSPYRTVFTHADLAPRNIMIRNGRLAAIIDWGFAGWYPEYWEFTKAHYTAFSGDNWEDFIRRVLPCYDTELAAEEILWRRLPEPGSKYTLSRGDVRIEHEGSSPSAAWMKAREGQPPDLWSLTLRDYCL